MSSVAAGFVLGVTAAAMGETSVAGTILVSSDLVSSLFAGTWKIAILLEGTYIVVIIPLGACNTIPDDPKLTTSAPDSVTAGPPRLIV